MHEYAGRMSEVLNTVLRFPWCSCREYAECKARELQRTRQEAEEAEAQLLKLSEDAQHKVR